MNATDRVCACGHPLHQQATICDTCVDSLLARPLGDVPWLAEELDVSITGQRAATYTGHTSRPAERPSPVHWGASEARAHLRNTLVFWVLFCDRMKVAHSSPATGLPEPGDLPAISRWLMWRIDGLASHDHGPDAAAAISQAVTRCHRVIDRPADKQFLGNCDSCPDGGRLYARAGSQWARCDTCDSTRDADTVRAALLDELDDRLCTAAEIARLSTYLGLRDDRDKVRNRINQWHKRGRITREAAFSEDPVFRFGIVWRLLVSEDGAGRVGAR